MDAIVQHGWCSYTDTGTLNVDPPQSPFAPRSTPVSSEAPGYIGSYRLLNVVNTGQTSLLWQAYDDRKKRFVAVKTLLDKFRRNREQIRYLKWEYAVGSKLIHDRIIRIFEYGIDRRAHYLAMEWFSAANLKQRVRQGADKIAYLTPKIIEEATEALVFFHSSGWVHCDVKPDNFLVADSGQVKLIDFALARRQKGSLSRFFSPKTKVQGTRSYMSPEQIRGEPLDQRADLYSLACTLFELVAGRPPYTGMSANELLMKHLKATPPQVDAVNNNATPDFAQVLRRAMAKKRSGRQDSVADFLTEVRMVRVFRRNPRPPAEMEPPKKDPS